jgi:hypothetical protein
MISWNFKLYPVVKFLVPGWGDKVDSGIGLSYRPTIGYIGRQAGATTLCRSQLYPPFRNYELGYCFVAKCCVIERFCDVSEKKVMFCYALPFSGPRILPVPGIYFLSEHCKPAVTKKHHLRRKKLQHD